MVKSAKIVDEKEAYEDLANAIIVLAAKDYKTAMIHRKKHPGNKGVETDIKKLERFFHSEWYELLTDIDASYLLRKIREKVEEEF